MANYTNSTLISYSNINHNNYTGYRAAINGVVIHHAAGVWSSAKSGCDYFATTTRQVSSNYCIGNDGSIGLSVPEKYRAWTTCGYDPDGYNITIEVSDAELTNYTISDKAMSALIKLVADIFTRNGIKEAKYDGTKTGSNLLMHKWYASTSCPGPYLEKKFEYIRDEVNKILKGTSTSTSTSTTSTTTTKTNTSTTNTSTTSSATTNTTTTTTKELYRIRKTWQDAKTQIGAYYNLESAKKACLQGYSVFNSKGVSVYSVEETRMYYVRKTWTDTKSQVGAFSVYNNAVYFCNQYKDYCVFDANGTKVHTSGAVAGDINGDGKCDVSDGRVAMQAAVGKVKLTDAQKSRGDMDGDGDVDVADAKSILNKAVGK